MSWVRTVILMGLVLCLGSCSSHRIRRELESFLSQEVVFPSSITCVSKTMQGTNLLLDSIPRLVIYVDSTQCSTCRVGHLAEYIPLHERAVQEKRFMLAVILSPPASEYDNIVHLLDVYDYPFPVYLDKNHSFRKENSFIPDDARFHAFLIDRSLHPVMVGDPTRSEKLRQLFEQTIQQLYSFKPLCIVPL